MRGPFLTSEMERGLEKRGFSRRDLGRVAAMLAAGAALPFYNEPALAQLSKVDAPPDAVFINANENPLGPCAEAREAAHRMVEYGGRYRFPETDKLQFLLAQQEGVKNGYVHIHPGSSGPLHQAVIAFTSPSRPLVTSAAATRWSGDLPLRRRGLRLRAESRIPAPEDGIEFVVEDLRPCL